MICFQILVLFCTKERAGNLKLKSANEIIVDSLTPLLYLYFLRYDPLSSCLVDFNKRANIISVKNSQFIISQPWFKNSNKTTEQILIEDSEKEFILQLGKVIMIIESK